MSELADDPIVTSDADENADDGVTLSLDAAVTDKLRDTRQSRCCSRVASLQHQRRR